MNYQKFETKINTEYANGKEYALIDHTTGTKWFKNTTEVLSYIKETYNTKMISLFMAESYRYKGQILIDLFRKEYFYYESL